MSVILGLYLLVETVVILNRLRIVIKIQDRQAGNPSLPWDVSTRQIGLTQSGEDHLAYHRPSLSDPVAAGCLTRLVFAELLVPSVTDEGICDVHAVSEQPALPVYPCVTNVCERTYAPIAYRSTCMIAVS